MEEPFIAGEPFVVLSRVDSTNTYALARIAEGPVAEGTAYCALEQTAGKGQRGRRWSSAPGENILLSLVLRPRRLPPGDQFLLSAAAALGVLDLLRAHAGPLSRIKWSNDLYWQDRKMGGMLIENQLRGSEWSYAVVGIGLNINQLSFPTGLPNPVSLREVTGRRHEVGPLARQLCLALGRRYAALRPGSHETLLEEYTRALYRLDEPAPYVYRGRKLEAVIRGVEKTGRLLLEERGRLLRADFGELVFLPAEAQGSRP